MFDFVDKYSVRARVFPALLTVVSVIVTAIAAFPSLVASWAAVGSVIVSCGGIYLLAQIGRDRGKRLEASLFCRWGGKPTSQSMSYCAMQNRPLVDRLHDQVMRLWPDIAMPDSAGECENPETAVRLYDEAVSRIRGATRDQEAFPLIFAENCNYGFRRNLWGLKPYGLVLTSLGLVVSVVFLFGASTRPSGADPTLLWVALILGVVLLFTWLGVVTPDWIRVTAEAYSDRLLEAVPELLRQRQAPPPGS